MSPLNPQHDPQHDGFAGLAALTSQEPLSSDLCLFVHSLLLDGRSVPAELVARVDVYVAQHAELQRVVGEFKSQHEALQSTPVVSVPEGFADRVLNARRPRPRLRLVRFAAAAALLMGVSLGWDLRYPAGALADPDTASGRWIVDELQPDPFGPLELRAALAKQLPGPLDAADDSDASAEQSSPDSEQR